ncbi:hypothetical protein IJH02_03620 [Candidatus Saccharibacteria bacterium]|nr:hypothetical protein [Candidatus Saccharibacteria bacterium]
MYSTVGLLKNSKKSGKLVGTHQKLDRIARASLMRLAPKGTFFPTIDHILHFEGNRGPDGLKWKSPGEDEPMHFLVPGHDDGSLMRIIKNHQYNLRKALKDKDEIRASFEAAWLAHAVTDGLTPAHHYPYQDAIEDLMSDKDYLKIFGKPVKGVMRGQNLANAARNNWLYWGPEGYMTKHIAFEYGVALVCASKRAKKLTPKIDEKELKDLDLKTEFYKSFEKINNLDMYARFRLKGWNNELASESVRILLPEIVRMIILAWYSALPEERSKK